MNAERGVRVQGHCVPGDPQDPRHTQTCGELQFVPPVQAPYGPQAQVSEHVRVWLPPPQFAQPFWVCIVPGAQTPCPPHVPHAPQPHAIVQVRERIPQLPQASVSISPGEHTPSPLHAPHAPHWHDAPHVRERIPQSPQLSVCT